MSFLRSARAVAWAFLGIRKRSGYEEDLGRLNPLHVAAVAFAAVLLLVVGLIALVNWIV
jgi:hypothetical protein